MPVLTNYWFSEPDFRGNAQFLNIGHVAGGWAWINWSNIGTTNSTLVWERENREVVIDLPPILNAPDILSRLDDLLVSPVSRTSDIKAGWIPWKYVPGHEKDPSRHGALDLLVRVFFNFHISTPWYCSDADGNISYYVIPYLDGSGRLHAYVDWWSYNFSGGAPFCAGEISSRLSSAVPSGVGVLQSLIDSRLALFADRRFDMLYLLPGNGTRSGGGVVNVNEHVSLALLPRSASTTVLSTSLIKEIK